VSGSEKLFTYKKTLLHPGRRVLQKYMFYAFMLVFCVLAKKILNGVFPSIVDEGVWVCRASLEEFVCEEVYESADGGHLKLRVKI